MLGTQAVRWSESTAGGGRFGARTAWAAARWPRAVRRTGHGGAHLAAGAAVLRAGGAGRCQHPRDRGAGTAHARRPVRHLDRSRHARRRARGRSAHRLPGRRRHPDGRVHLYARTADRGLATRVREPGGHWGRGDGWAAAPFRTG
ncbi:hypothetical protein NKH77_30895 [Streptomyces sp. M19]